MRKRGLSIQKALILFLSLTTIFTSLAVVLALKLPKKISTMNEVKAAVVELKETKNKQEENLELVVNEMDEMSMQIESLQGNLQEIQILEKEQVDTIEELTDVKYAYLTFDDGPSQNTIKILDFLKLNNIKATFFVIGKEGCDDIYKRIVDEGHTLAIHSNTHIYSDIYLSVYAFMKDITTLGDKLEKITGIRPTIMRFPGGSNNTVSYKYGGKQLMDKLVKEVTNKGYVYYDWNVDSSDATSNNRSKEAIFNAVMNGVQGKDEAIILMHDAAAKGSTVEALPEIVSGLRKKGYILEPITEETSPVQFKKNN
ncbi:MAG: polysaccharide deacetylase [Cellulosilyticum sp.]|nr:polysaccharide deacetylase [Cellulosilyticum sp.]